MIIKKYIFLILLLELILINLNAQEKYVILYNNDTAIVGTEIISYKDKIVVLGTSFKFDPPYSGTPIEGEYTYGSRLFLLDANLNILKEQQFTNGGGAYGVIPAYNMHLLDTEEIIIPYSINKGIVTCDNSNFAIHSKQVEAISVNMFSNINPNIEFHTINDLNCEDQEIINSFTNKNYSVTISYDKYRKQIEFRWLNKNNISFQKKVYQYKNLSQHGNILCAEKDQNFFVFGSDSTFESLLILKFNSDGNIISEYKFPIKSSFKKIVNKSGDLFLLIEDEYVANNWKQYIYELNPLIGIVRKVQITNSIVDITPINETEFAILYKNLNTDPLRAFRIAKLDSALTFQNEKIYNYNNSVPNKIKILENGKIAVVGSVYTKHEYTSKNNPYFKTFVLLDNFDILLENRNLNPLKKLSIYPNPAKNEIIIITKDEETKIQALALFSSNGNKILSTKINTPSNEYFFDVSDLSSGIYIIQIELNNGNKVNKKIIKN